MKKSAVSLPSSIVGSRIRNWRGNPALHYSHFHFLSVSILLPSPYKSAPLNTPRGFWANIVSSISWVCSVTSAEMKFGAMHCIQLYYFPENQLTTVCRYVKNCIHTTYWIWNNRLLDVAYHNSIQTGPPGRSIIVLEWGWACRTHSLQCVQRLMTKYGVFACVLGV